MDLFGRVVRVEVGLAGQQGRSWEGLRVGFNVKKTSKGTPNKADISIYNLTSDSSAACQVEHAMVRLWAGYKAPGMIFQGDIDRCNRVIEKTEAITKIEAADGGRAFRAGWISKTYAAGTSSTQILAELSAASAIPVAHQSALPVVQITQSLTLNGPVRDCMETLCRAVEAEWSIQDGGMIILLPGQTTPEASVLISPESGLVGSPTRTKHGVELTSLLQPTIYPGRRFQLQSREFKGVYKAKEVEHVGDSGWETDFYTKIVAVPAS
jgi:hypothetical protein